MFWRLQSLVYAVIYIFSVATFAQDDTTPTDTASIPQESACGYIVNTSNTTGQLAFDATLAFSCLTSVPINTAIASSLLSYVNDTLQFQSTLSYLKTPPASYQQPPIDLIAGINQIQHNVNAGAYQNQYAFETALQLLLLSAHDTHLYVAGGISNVFTFAVTTGIVSASVDGKQLPKLYFENDLVTYLQAGLNNTPINLPSAIATINGQPATSFLANFANMYAIGALDPHSAYNQALSSATLDVLGSPSLLEGATTLYPGDQWIFTLENGTTLEPFPWVAYYNSPGDTGPLATPGDFFNFFVTGFYPASYTPPDTDTSAKRGLRLERKESEGITTRLQSRQDRSGGLDNEAYPYPNVSQPDLSTTGNGVLSGYFLDTGVAVLSIPSFDERDEGLDTFRSTVSTFIAESKAAGMTKLVLDLQENMGGQSFLAIDTFKQFFPDTQPFLGSRARASQYLSLTGEQLTDFYDDLDLEDPDYYELTPDEFVATTRINALTGQNFTSWDEFFGPVQANGDTYTAPQQYNLSSFVFDVEARGGHIQLAVFGYANNPANYTDPPYAAEDVIVLTDGQCASSCALFVEMMTQDAGVRTVVAGGLPMTGPMQAVGLTRGAALEATDQLDGNIAFAQDLDSDAAALLPNRTNEDTWISAAGVNFRDQVRENDTEPLQFKYLAADCRIFYTVDNFYAFPALWQYAADAIWKDPSMCVEGSTGFAGTAQLPPPIPDELLRTGQSPAEALAGTQFIPLDSNTQAAGNLQDAGRIGSAHSALSLSRTCSTNQPNPCPGGKPCPRTKLIDKARSIYSGVCPSTGGTVVTKKGTCSNCAKRRR